MTTRNEAIYAAGEELLSQRLQENMNAIMLDFQSESELHCSAFNAKIDGLMKKVDEAQKVNTKSAIQYLCFSFLHSSLYVKSYELRIDAYNENFYKDTYETCVYWDAGFIFRYYAQDMEHFKRHIGLKIPRVKEYELMCFAQRYAMHYYRIAQQFIRDQINWAISKESYQDVRFTDKLNITFGGLNDYPVLLAEKDML